MFAIIFTFIFMYTSFRKLRRSIHVKLLLNLCFVLLGLYVTFIISTVSTGVPVLCGVVSALMHYFFLAVFFWMAAEAIQLHRKLVTVFKPDITSYVTFDVMSGACPSHDGGGRVRPLAVLSLLLLQLLLI